MTDFDVSHDEVVILSKGKSSWRLLADLLERDPPLPTFKVADLLVIIR